jgi:hypothetical protein
MNLFVPAIPVTVWILVFWGITLAILLGGGYERVERLAMLKVGLFTDADISGGAAADQDAAVFLRGRRLPKGSNFECPARDFRRQSPSLELPGVGASELFMYPYWCVEKGYARFAGRREDTPEWDRRARGWIRVMRLDIIASMIIYTVATIAFYLLGAGNTSQYGQGSGGW